MRIYYVRYGNFEPEEVRADGLRNLDLAVRVKDYLDDKYHTFMHEIDFVEDGELKYNTFDEWVDSFNKIYYRKEE
jgi:hypothetical protein